MPEPKKKQTLFDRLSRVRLGHEAVMMEDAREVLAQQRTVAGKHQQAEAEPMGDLILGDVINNVTNTDSSSGKDKPAASGLAKLGLGAALMATGLGGGFGAAMLLDGGKDVIDNVKDKPEIRYLLDLGGGQEVSEGSEGNR